MEEDSTIKDECATDVSKWMVEEKGKWGLEEEAQSNRMCYKEKHNLTECATKKSTI